VSATPETNSRVRVGFSCDPNTYFVVASFCREMEQQRDEARELVGRLLATEGGRDPQAKYDALRAAMTARVAWKEQAK
jgi:hypothetical protein